MTDKRELENSIKQIFLEVFPEINEYDFDFNKSQEDYENWDSFAQLNIITLAEAKFNISLSLDESIEVKSGKDLLECVNSHLSC